MQELNAGAATSFAERVATMSGRPGSGEGTTPWASFAPAVGAPANADRQAPGEGLVLRDDVACFPSGGPSGWFEECGAQDERQWPTAGAQAKNEEWEADLFDDAAPPPPDGVEVDDYIELGRIVADWSARAETRPDSVDALIRQLGGVARIPTSIRRVEFVEDADDVLVIRLPARAPMEKRLSELESPLVGDPVRLPRFYDDIYRRNFGPEMSALDTFLARMGDQTIARCG